MSTVQIKEDNKWFHISKQLLPVKIFYFLCLAGVGALLPFIALYMKQLGLSTSDTGIIYGIMPFVGFLVRPLVGSIADKLRKHKLILSILCLSTAISYVMLLLVPQKRIVTTNVTTKIHCNQLDSYIRDCYKFNSSATPTPSCPMTLDNYANLMYSSRKNDDISLDVNSEPLNYTSAISYVASEDVRTPVNCAVSCSIKSESGAACFTNSQGPFSSQCAGRSVQLLKNQELTFDLPNVTNSLQREVMEDRQIFGDKICRDYDIKSVVYSQERYWQILCSQDLTMECSLHCTKLKSDDCSVNKPVHLMETFWIFFVLYLIGNIAFSPIISIGDAMSYDILGEKRDQWGKQRLWGTVGFALFAITSTFIMDKVSKSPLETDFSISFYLFGGLFTLLAFCTLCFMPASENVKCSNVFKDVCKLFRYSAVVVFLLIVFYMGLLTGVIETFLFWYLQDKLNNKLNIIPGLCLLVNCVIETPVLFFSGLIIRKIGHLKCLYVVLFCYFLRFTAYSLLTAAWQVLFVEPLHGITFGLMWATATSYGNIITPKGLGATIQGLIGGLHFGFGKGVGSLVTGLLYGPLGIRWTFRLYGVVSLGLMLLYFLLNYCKVLKSAHDEPPACDERNDEDITIPLNDKGNVLLQDSEGEQTQTEIKE